MIVMLKHKINIKNGTRKQLILLIVLTNLMKSNINSKKLILKALMKVFIKFNMITSKY